ncbi:protein B4 isoform X3 [Hyla sarda]|uniref:protein B4 isoform X3 n=1 Tax=Hyla sarda TaxID=327740 RepID=UPI0024C41508|nr:protein B4 isoform X3 [Hyla sarda]
MEETKAKPKVVKLKTLGHPPTLTMVVEVLKKNPERKGTSVPAIRNHILAAHPTVDAIRLKFLLRSALNKGIEKGILIRPPNSNATGATGRFKLAKPGLKSKGNVSENVDPNVQPKEKTVKSKEKVKKVVKKVSKKPKADKESKAEENTEEDNDTDKKEETPEPQGAASKPKKQATGNKNKAPAPAKKPKSKTVAAEEGEKPKKVSAKKAGSAKTKETEEKSSVKGKK